MARKFVFRIDQEGVEELRRNLERLGKDGQKAFRDLSQASPQLANPLTQAERRIEATRRSLERLGRQGGGHLRSLGLSAAQTARSFLGLNAPIAALAGTAGIGLLARRALEFTDNLQETADTLGLTAEQLQIYQAGALQAGLGTDKLTQGLAIFEKKMADAKDGQKEAVELFKKWKLPILEADDSLRSLGAVLPEFAEKVRTAETPAKALQIVMEAFGGKLGKDFINFLSGGAAGFDDMASSATLAGQIMGNDLVRQGALAKDQMDALGLTIRTSFNIGLIESFGGSFADFARAASDPELQGAVRDLGRSVGELVRVMLDNAPGVLSFLADMVRLLREGSEWARELAQYHPTVLAFQAGRDLIRPSPATGTGLISVTPPGGTPITAADSFATNERAERIKTLQAERLELERTLGIIKDFPLAEAVRGELLRNRLDDVRQELALQTQLQKQVRAGTPGASAAGAPPASGGPFGLPVVTGTGTGGGSAPIDQETRAREQALAAIDQMIQGYREEAQLLGLGSAERERQQALFQAEEILRRANLTLTEQQRQALVAAVGAQQEAATRADAQATAQDRVNQILEEYARIQEAALDPAERFQAIVARLRADLAAGAISQAQFNAGVAALPAVLDQAADRMDEIKQGAQGVLSTITSWSVAGGSFGQVVGQIEQQILQLLASAASQSIGERIGTVKPDSGLGFEDVFNAITGFLFHSGGVAGRGGGASRSVSAGAFMGAPRLHDGFGGAGSPFRPGEFPAILQKNEAVIPLIGGAVPVRLMGGNRERGERIIEKHYFYGDSRDGRRQTGRQQMGEMMRAMSRGTR